MKILKPIITLFFLLTSFPTFGLELSPLAKILYQLEMKNSWRNTGQSSNGRQQDRANRCHEIYDSHKNFWSENTEREEALLIPNAKLDRAPTTEEILDRENRVRFPNKLIKGNSKSLRVAWMLGGAPDFPHHRPGCSKFFEYEVTLIKIDETPCRQVRFYSPKNTSKEYYQVYCAKEKSVFINFHQDNRLKRPSDCVHCR